MAAEGLSPAMEVEQLYKTLPPVRPRRHRRPSRRLAAACLRRLHCRSGLPGGASPHEGGQRRTPAHALASAATVRRGGERWLERVGGCPCIGGRAAAAGERALTGRDPQDARRDVPRQTRDPLARQWHATAAVSNLLATPDPAAEAREIRPMSPRGTETPDRTSSCSMSTAPASPVGSPHSWAWRRRLRGGLMRRS